MKIALATLGVLLCIGINSSQAGIMDSFPSIGGIGDVFDSLGFGDMFSGASPKNSMSSMKSIDKMFDTCHDSQAKADVRDGSISMSKQGSSTGPHYDISMGGTKIVDGVKVQVLQVRKNGCGPSKTIYPEKFVINDENKLAFDCRPYTMCNFALSATMHGDVSVIIFYGPRDCDGDSVSCFDSDSSDDSNNQFSNVINCE